MASKWSKQYYELYDVHHGIANLKTHGTDGYIDFFEINHPGMMNTIGYMARLLEHKRLEAGRLKKRLHESKQRARSLRKQNKQLKALLWYLDGISGWPEDCWQQARKFLDDWRDYYEI